MAILRAMPESPRLQFGLVPPPTFIGVDRHVDTLLRWVGERSGLTLVRRQVASYDDLARMLRSEILHVAWLPPIPFARLDVEGVARELVCVERGGGDDYVAVLVARTGSAISTVSDLEGKRIGWVDPLSATGYVVPRMRLAAMGVALDRTFAKETFFGSHAAVVRAVLEGVVDVGATYGGFTDGGHLSRGAFLDLGSAADELDVVTSFGAIPPDVLAVHARVAEPVRALLAEAFEATHEDAAAAEAVRLTFGATRLVRQPLVGYDLLRSEVAHGVDSGVIPAAAAFLSTHPPRRGH